jgi:hypothetical protein
LWLEKSRAGQLRAIKAQTNAAIGAVIIDIDSTKPLA